MTRTPASRELRFFVQFTRVGYQAHPGGVFGLSLSPDGTHLASVGADGWLRVWNARELTIVWGVYLARHAGTGPGLGRSPRSSQAWVTERLADVPAYATTVAWSPSGRRLLAACGPTVFVIGTKSRTILRSSRWSDNQVWAAQWVGPTDGRIVVLDARGAVYDSSHLAKPRPKPEPVASLVRQVWAAAVSPDGREVVVGTNVGGLLMRRSTGKTAVVADSHWAAPVEAVAWPAHGGPVVANYGGDVTFCSPEATRNHTVHKAQIRSLAVAPDGTVGASGDDSGNVHVWDRNGTVLEVVQGHAGPVRALAATPDLRTVYSGGEDGTLRAWVADGPVKGAGPGPAATRVIDV